MKTPDKRNQCKFCGSNTRWIDDEWGLKTLVDVPGYGKHICLKNKKSPIEKFIATNKRNDPSPIKNEINGGLTLEERVAWLEYELELLKGNLK